MKFLAAFALGAQLLSLTSATRTPQQLDAIRRDAIDKHAGTLAAAARAEDARLRD